MHSVHLLLEVLELIMRAAGHPEIVVCPHLVTHCGSAFGIHLEFRINITFPLCAFNIDECQLRLRFHDHLPVYIALVMGDINTFDIRREFGLSKNAFKRAVGHLLKEGKVEIRGKRIYRL